MSIAIPTARDILLEAFDDINVHMDETTLGASDERTGVNTINRIMAALAADGVALGFTKLTKINDLVTIPEGGMDALVSLLAYRLWPKYRTPEPSGVISSNARRGQTQLHKLSASISATEYPSTLPKGSGNTGTGYNYDTFYSEAESTILSEYNGSISLEDDTDD